MLVSTAGCDPVLLGTAVYCWVLLAAMFGGPHVVILKATDPSGCHAWSSVLSGAQCSAGV